jgi:hypothetical protein
MEIQEIEVVIDKTGRVQIQVRGVQGQKCLELTKDLEAALGGQVLSRELTAEAYSVDQEVTRIQERA